MNNTTETTTTTRNEDDVEIITTDTVLAVETHNGFEITVAVHTYRRTFGPTCWLVERGQFENGHTDFSSNIKWHVPGVGYSAGNIDAKTNTENELPTQKRIALSIAAAKKAIDRQVEDDAMRPQLAQLVHMNCETIPATSRIPQVGEIARLYSRGADRFGIVTKVTASKIEIAYVTQGGIDEAARCNTKTNITRKAAHVGSVKVVA
jgi:hypothetical protein